MSEYKDKNHWIIEGEPPKEKVTLEDIENKISSLNRDISILTAEKTKWETRLTQAKAAGLKKEKPVQIPSPGFPQP